MGIISYRLFAHGRGFLAYLYCSHTERWEQSYAHVVRFAQHVTGERRWIEEGSEFI